MSKSGDNVEGAGGQTSSADNVDNGATHPEDKKEDKDEEEETPNDVPTPQKRSKEGNVYGDTPTRGAI